MSKEADLERLRKRFQKGELSLDELGREKARLGLGKSPIAAETREYSSSWKKVALFCGAVLAIAGVVAGLTTVSAAGLDCGSVFSPEPWRGLNLDALYSDELCKRALGERSPVAWTLIVLGVALTLGSLISARKPHR